MSVGRNALQRGLLDVKKPSSGSFYINQLCYPVEVESRRSKDVAPLLLIGQTLIMSVVQGSMRETILVTSCKTIAPNSICRYRSCNCSGIWEEMLLIAILLESRYGFIDQNITIRKGAEC